jgi:hypothetical protein
MASRRVGGPRGRGECARDVGADVRSWPSASPLRSRGAKRRKRVRMLEVRSSRRRAIA